MTPSGIRVGSRNFPLLEKSRPALGRHSSSQSMGTRGSFPGVKRTGQEGKNSTPPSAKVKNDRSYTSTSLICKCLQQVNRNILSSVSGVSKERVYCSEPQKTSVRLRAFPLFRNQMSVILAKFGTNKIFQWREHTHSPPAAIPSQPHSVGP